MGEPPSPLTQPGSVLKSNVDAVEIGEAAQPPRRFPVGLVLGAVLLLVVGVAAGVVLASMQQRPPPSAARQQGTPNDRSAATALPAAPLAPNASASGAGRVLPQGNVISR